MTQPDNTTPAGSGQDSHLGELTLAAALLLLTSHAAEALRFEHAAALEAQRLVQAAAADLLRWATRLWAQRFGDLTAPIDPVQASGITAELAHRLHNTPRPDPTVLLQRQARQAVELGARQGAADVGVTRPIPVEVSKPTLRMASDVTTKIRKRYDDTQRLLKTQPIVTHADVVTVLAPTQAAAADADTAARTITNTAINEGLAKTAEHHGADLLWFSERDACFVASTRVLAPAVLVERPGGPAREVAGDPPDGLTLDPSALDVPLRGNPGASTATALARPVRDRFGEVQAVSSREYVGDVVDIRTASGKQLTGTPNHPIATRGGWIPLGELKVGDHVFSRQSAQRVPVGVDPDDYDAPPTIDEVAQAFPVAVGVVPTAPEDFHGDGAGSEIHVVRADGLLLDEADGSCPQHGGELPLDRGDVQLPLLARLGLGLLRRLRALAALLPLGRACRQLGELLGRERGTSAEVAAGCQAVPLEPSAHRDRVDAVDHGYFLERLAGLVEADEIVEVGRREFRGQVFNLQTVEGWYLADDIAVHNCVVCLSLSGEVVAHDESFNPDLTFGRKPVPWWTPHGVTLLRPPRHNRCRCRAEPFLGHGGPPGSMSLPQALKREAARSVIKGWALESEPDSVRRDAANRLLQRGGAGLPKSVQARARRQVASEGKFKRAVPTGDG